MAKETKDKIKDENKLTFDQILKFVVGHVCLWYYYTTESPSIVLYIKLYKQPRQPDESEKHVWKIDLIVTYDDYRRKIFAYN